MRKVADCRKFPGSTCSVTISGEENEVIPLATYHAVNQHGYQNTADLQSKIRQTLSDEA